MSAIAAGRLAPTAKGFLIEKKLISSRYSLLRMSFSELIQHHKRALLAAVFRAGSISMQ